MDQKLGRLGMRDKKWLEGQQIKTFILGLDASRRDSLHNGVIMEQLEETNAAKCICK